MKKQMLCFLVAIMGHAYAGQKCETPVVSSNLLSSKIIKAGDALERQAETWGDSLYLIARVGQNLEEYGLRFSHMGILFRDAHQRWSVIHKLNTCGTEVSDVVIQDTMNFFADDMYRYDVGMIRLKPELAMAWRSSILDNNYADTHVKKYSLVSYPWDATSQNSNEWVLDYLTKISMGRTNVQMSDIKSTLKRSSFQSSTLEIGALKRLGARITKANVTFEDHPFGQRMSGHIETTTVESIASYLSRESKTLCGEDQCRLYVIPEERLQ